MTGYERHAAEACPDRRPGWTRRAFAPTIPNDREAPRVDFCWAGRVDGAMRRLTMSLPIVFLRPNGTAGAADDLAAAWDFQAATAASAPDTSGNGNTGTLDGGVQPIVDSRGPALFFPPAAVAVGPVMMVA